MPWLIHAFQRFISTLESTKPPPIRTPAPFRLCSLNGMSTERQQQASRANGSKSRGPVTPAGQSSPPPATPTETVTGMLSGTIVLEGESTDRFLCAPRRSATKNFSPRPPSKTPSSKTWPSPAGVRCASGAWKRPAWSTKCAGKPECRTRTRQRTPPHAPSLAFRTLSDDSRSLELINRYESRYDRQYLPRPPPPPRSARPPTPPPSDRGRACRRPSAPHPDSRQMPCESTNPAPPPAERVVISKGTREVVANKPSLDTRRQARSSPPHEIQDRYNYSASSLPMIDHVRKPVAS